jgi:D-alanyl-D-alanine dipeptidase
VSELFPKLDPKAPVVPLRRGDHAGMLWIEPIYHREGYEEALAEVWLRAEAARRLVHAAGHLVALGYGLKLLDGWRPLQLQRTLRAVYGAALERESGLIGKALEERLGAFVSPVDTADPPPHATGGAVDVTLCATDDGSDLDMGGSFDELGDRSLPNYYEERDIPAEQVEVRDRRRLLAQAMLEAGFWQLPTEWWHFEYGTVNWARETGEEPLFTMVEAADPPD